MFRAGFVAAGVVLALSSSTVCLAQLDEFKTYDSDREWAELATWNPGFAGHYFDSEGKSVLLVTDAERKADVKAGLLTSGALQEPDTVRVVTYEFNTLYSYKQRVQEILSEPGAVYVDLDEVNNRIVIAVDQDTRTRSVLFADTRAAVKSLASRYGVPEKALAIIETEPIEQAATLRSRLRPTPGGMQISFGANSACTLGVVVQQGATNGFITNSHCTNIQGGVEGTLYYQPTISSGNLIATEIADPPYLSGGSCPSGRVCRTSDSALARFTSNNMGLGHWGYVAKPPCKNCGSLSISTAYPRLKMVYSSRTSPPVGDQVQKVGRTTGWTKGPVTNTCVSTNVAESNITLLCQSIANAGVGPGDSGSAVIRGSHRQRRAFRGLLWGQLSSTRFVFSPAGAVESEIGAVDTWP